jgi:thimet oligopeptidase
MELSFDYANLTVERLEQVNQQYFEKYEQLVECLLGTPNNMLTWENTVQCFINLDNTTIDTALFNMKDFHTNQEIRDKCTELSTEMSKWAIDMGMRKDIYDKIKYYYENQFVEDEARLTSEQRKYLDDMMIGYSLKGFDLMEEQYNRVKEIKKEISELCANFEQNMSNENYSEDIEIDSIKGLPYSYIEKRKVPNTTMVNVTLKYPDYIPIMEYADNRDVRKHFCTLFKSRCIVENTPIIEKVFNLRSELASIMGYQDYSDYKLVESMAGDTNTVMNFLNDLLYKIRPILKKDMEALNNLHQEIGYKDKVEIWDVPYYSRIITEKICQFNKEELKQYFPKDTVISGALSIYQKLLGLRFTKINDAKITSMIWHDSVELYGVECSESHRLMGYFYLDLHPREGKFTHAACFPFIHKSESTLPVSTIGCNFNTDYMTFDEVETFFHEFGHTMHSIVSKAKIGSMSSFSCEHDFVETPSQMFEEWCYEPETLRMMSRNIPDDIIEKLRVSRKVLQGWHYARQLMFGIFDMSIHSGKYKSLDMTPAELFSSIQYEVLGLKSIPNTSEPASFGHMMGGYDAGYYGYLWSLVYAKDLFSVFKNKLLDRELGKKLRNEVLSQGSIRSSMRSLRLFLGREPSNEEFIKSI